MNHKIDKNIEITIRIHGDCLGIDGQYQKAVIVPLAWSHTYTVP